MTGAFTARREASVALIPAASRFRQTSPVADRRSLTVRTFTRFLGKLHPDAEEAAHEYERLRRALVKFFDWRGTSAPDECADDVLDRLAHKLDQTVVHDIRKYVRGIARLVALERRRGPAFDALEENSYTAPAPPAEDEDAVCLHDCFDRCLAELSEENRQLILQYYEGERSAKISNRRRLADGLGLTENALRSRVQRLRDRLERCVRSCSTRTVGRTS